MPSIVWKGHLTFGLVSIPEKLYRAARGERLRMHYVHQPEVPEEPPDEAEIIAEVPVRSVEQAPHRLEAFPPTREQEPAPEPPAPVMYGREHVVVIRPGEHGILAHTMFYVDEIRSETEFRTDIGSVGPKELELAKTFLEALAAPFRAGRIQLRFDERQPCGGHPPAVAQTPIGPRSTRRSLVNYIQGSRTRRRGHLPGQICEWFMGIPDFNEPRR